MKNEEVARLLREMGDLLELRGESGFKVVAYRRAARSVESMKEDLEEVSRRGELETIPGVGKAIASKISEFLDTGKIGAHDRLFQETPQGMAELLEISGLGPKTISMLHEKLGVSTVEELERAVREHRVRRLPRMGPTSEKNILRAIERWKKRSDRIPLGVALPIAERILGSLRRVEGVRNLTLAGSLRRGRETVGDIDILATSESPGAAIRAFVEIPAVEEVLMKGPTKASVIVDETVQVDLRIVEPRSFGTVVQYFTGSKEHNVRLRQVALSKGYSLSEYSLTRVANGEELFFDREEDLYHHLGMDWIPPEIREDQGEVEAALAGRLPRLIEVSDIKGDLHVHSDWSDGRHSIEEMVKTAKKLGYEYMAICDHSPSLGIANGLAEDRFKEKMELIRSLNGSIEGFSILVGTEVDIRADGKLDYPDEILSQCDVVVASVHSAYNQREREMTNRIISAMESEEVDVIGHPTGRKIGEREAYEVDMERVLEAAARTKTAMEINAHPSRLDLNGRWARRAKELEVKLAINTDAHSTCGLMAIEYGIKTARRGWLEEKDVLNTLGIADLLKYLDKV
ncbi:MAG: DNA polymerase/3'-5' exonuclease PolX [Methanothrix sp.]|nr:DNA polymerase/3'-5' exonuclease PolX [Methanothrix harundinacea]MDD3708760.1 DNA polymerase/3'-5' exonuclease PolX [Methanothrix sp.]MDD5767471.1 DNA polymerase/3'-5' exonuclease PolX [Methanothrix sp.]MDI9399749.1 DNA polymerase/3'-5' exonuclease PolX [Euryarchaeota archaeon]